MVHSCMVHKLHGAQTSTQQPSGVNLGKQFVEGEEHHHKAPAMLTLKAFSYALLWQMENPCSRDAGIVWVFFPLTQQFNNIRENEVFCFDWHQRPY